MGCNPLPQPSDSGTLLPSLLLKQTSQSRLNSLAVGICLLSVLIFLPGSSSASSAESWITGPCPRSVTGNHFVKFNRTFILIWLTDWSLFLSSFSSPCCLSHSLSFLLWCRTGTFLHLTSAEAFQFTHTAGASCKRTHSNEAHVEAKWEKILEPWSVFLWENIPLLRRNAKQWFNLRHRHNKTALFQRTCVNLENV